MGICCCSLAGSQACINCPNNTGIINNHMTYVQEYTQTTIQYEPYDPEEALKRFDEMIKIIEDGGN